MNLQIIEHPVVRHHLTQLRDHTTSPEQFRSIVGRLTNLLVFRATECLELRPRQVQTPLTDFLGNELSQSIGLVPILRAGLGMIDPVLSLLPTAEVWHLGLYRDETTSRPVEYYSKLPPGRPVDVAMVLDPMLATGGSAVLAYHTLKRWGVPQVKLLRSFPRPKASIVYNTNALIWKFTFARSTKDSTNATLSFRVSEMPVTESSTQRGTSERNNRHTDRSTRFSAPLWLDPISVRSTCRDRCRIRRS